MLKTSVMILEGIFPSRSYVDFDEKIVNEIENIKADFLQPMMSRMIQQGSKKDKQAIIVLLANYLPHFMCSNFKRAREVF